MTYYLDSEFRVHLEPGENRQAWTDEDGFFDRMADAMKTGYRVIPAGRTWTRPDGKPFAGPMIAPAQDLNALALAALNETSAVLNELMGGVMDVQQE